jgi:membrane-associated PAP2 superfamily phosphatase
VSRHDHGTALCLVVCSVLVPVVVLGLGTHVDVRISDRIYAAGGGAWPIPHSGWMRQVAYDGAKRALVIFALYLLAGAWKPALLRPIGLERREAVFVFVCLVLIPSLISLVKYHSGVYCAADLARYGGAMPDSSGQFVLSRLFAVDPPHGCWPSGHASGGFALLALGALPRSAPTRRRLWCMGLAIGSTMGAYQVLRGAHFLSHILITALVAQAVVCALAPFFFRQPEAAR